MSAVIYEVCKGNGNGKIINKSANILIDICLNETSIFISYLEVGKIIINRLDCPRFIATIRFCYALPSSCAVLITLCLHFLGLASF